jgi:hypothetical protein
MLIPLGILAVAGAGGVSAILAGYFAGGATSEGGTGSTTVDKFAFPSDTRTTLGTGLSTNTARTAGFANSNVAGYIGRENDSGNTDKFDFSNDSRTTIAVGVEFGRSLYAGHANSGVAGYFLCGRRADNGQRTARATKFAFPSDTTSNIADAHSEGVQSLAGMANSGTAGYIGGGQNGSGSQNRTATVRKMAYSNDSSSTLATGLSIPINQLSAMANSGTAGYFAGGIGVPSEFAETLTTVNKYAFSNDSRSTLGTGLSVARRILAGMAHSGTAGYVGGGMDNDVIGKTTVDKFAFPSDTRSTLGTGLSSARVELAAMASSGVL